VPPTSPKGTPRNTARDLAQIAVFAALIIALGLPGTINIGGSAVPITLQTLGVMLAGALLGPRKGTLAVLTVIVLGLALPVLAGGRTSLVSLSSPTAGFLIGWLPAAALIGWLSYLMLPKYNLFAGIAINLLGGIVVLYTFGIAGMLIKTDMTVSAAFAANVTFLPGDVIKAVVAAAVAAQVHRAYPALAASRVRTVPVRADAADAA